eukprot:6174570-Pleurochrysis_carterae.AAC.8
MSRVRPSTSCNQSDLDSGEFHAARIARKLLRRHPESGLPCRRIKSDCAQVHFQPPPPSPAIPALKHLSVTAAQPQACCPVKPVNWMRRHVTRNAHTVIKGFNAAHVNNLGGPGFVELKMPA